jgi:hypothetical protein
MIRRRSWRVNQLCENYLLSLRILRVLGISMGRGEGPGKGQLDERGAAVSRVSLLKLDGSAERPIFPPKAGLRSATHRCGVQGVRLALRVLARLDIGR